MIQQISLSGLRCRGNHGVFAFEREQGQEFVIDLALRVDVSRAVASDDIAFTVDYSLLADRIAKEVAGEPVNLIETLAERLLRVVQELGESCCSAQA